VNALERALRSGRAARAVYDLGAQDRGEPADPADAEAFTKRAAEFVRATRATASDSVAPPSQLSLAERDGADRMSARLSRSLVALPCEPRPLADLTVYPYGYGPDKRPWVLSRVDKKGS